MGYKTGQVVEVCSERSKGWTPGFNKGSKITLGERFSDGNSVFEGEWNAVSSSGGKGIIAEDDFRELVEGPVRTVTRQEVIPGTYDGVEVGSEVTGHPQREVMVRIAIDHGPMVCMNADQLDRAAAVLTALAGALRDAS